MPLVRLFLDICSFNKGPQDAPASSLLLELVVAANLGLGFGLALMELGWVEALLQTLTGASVLAGFLWIALAVTQKSARFLQTASAAFGTDTFITALATPLLIWGHLDPEMRGAFNLPLLSLMAWQISVLGHILRHALSLPFIAGLGLALAYTVISYSLILSLFPVAN